MHQRLKQRRLVLEMIIEASPTMSCTEVAA
jgi:hypothetical protein